MSYVTGEALLLAQLRQVNGLDADSARRNDVRILNRGKAPAYAVLRPGPFTREPASLGGLGIGPMTIFYRWTTYCDVYQRIGPDYPASVEALTALEQLIMDRLDQYRLAGDETGAVQDVFVTAGSDPAEILNGRWAMRTLTIAWTEEVQVTLQE